MVTNSYRTFGSEREIDENLLQILSKVYAALNGAFRVGWGFLFDKFNFFHLYIILFSNQILVSGSYYFSALTQYTFFTTTSLAVISLAGHTTFFPPLLGHCSQRFVHFVYLFKEAALDLIDFFINF